MAQPKQSPALPAVKIGDTTYTILFPALLRTLTGDENDRLGNSIVEHGVLSALLVDEHNGVMDGGHRLRHAKLSGLTRVPVTVLPGLTDDQKRQIALDSNLDRRHLTPAQQRSSVAGSNPCRPGRAAAGCGAAAMQDKGLS
jgi:hypothetical protein